LFWSWSCSRLGLALILSLSYLGHVSFQFHLNLIFVLSQPHLGFNPVSSKSQLCLVPAFSDSSNVQLSLILVLSGSGLSIMLVSSCSCLNLVLVSTRSYLCLNFALSSSLMFLSGSHLILTSVSSQYYLGVSLFTCWSGLNLVLVPTRPQLSIILVWTECYLQGYSFFLSWFQSRTTLVIVETFHAYKNVNKSKRNLKVDKLKLCQRYFCFKELIYIVEPS
jgi:hypothetical protein